MSHDESIEHVSDTALWVAAFRHYESQRPDALFRDPLAPLLTGPRGLRIARAMPYPRIIAWIMAIRTASIDRLVKEAVSGDVDTVVNLGAGLDTRPYRLELPARLKWIEVDLPRLITLKEERLRTQTPRCLLERIPLDLSDHAAATRIYGEIGARSRTALIITEGVIPYLSNEQAASLASDLTNVPAFKYWIQDYVRGNAAWYAARRLKKHLKNAPFRFDHPDPMAFFALSGWVLKTDLIALDEGERLGRPFPFPLSSILLKPFRRSMGYALFERR